MTAVKAAPGIIPASATFAYPTMPIITATLLAVVSAAMLAKVSYKLGAKAPSLSSKPGKGGYTAIDCSGFVRLAVYQATGGKVKMPDGSVVQYDWIVEQGFKKSDVASGKLKDGAVRIAFLRQQDSSSGVGHVLLIHNGTTIESNGSNGPNRRIWSGEGYQAKCKVFVLLEPQSTAPKE